MPTTVAVLTAATSANPGPGFGTLGLALQLYNRFDVEVVDGDPHCPQIIVQGALGKGLSTGPDNLFFRAFARLFQRRQIDLPAVKIRMSINISAGCGLGSTATAVVGCLAAAIELRRLHARAVRKHDLLPPALDLQPVNHP